MATAKNILVAPIAAAPAREFIRHHHYSGTYVRGSFLHLGVFLDGRCEGVMQFGPPMDKRKSIGLVAGTRWFDFWELNRMAFTDALPRNSESRALGVAMRIIRREYPSVQWVLSFADGTQCGDGTIYRASGFVLTGITKNQTIYRFPNGRTLSNLSMRTGSIRRFADVMGRDVADRFMVLRRKMGDQAAAVQLGAEKLRGFQLRYIYFLEPGARERLTVPVLTQQDIDQAGAGMYRGIARGK